MRKPLGPLHLHRLIKAQRPSRRRLFCERLCLNESLGLLDHCGVFLPEVIAVKDFNPQAFGATRTICTICIFSDSRAALKAFDGFSSWQSTTVADFLMRWQSRMTCTSKGYPGIGITREIDYQPSPIGERTNRHPINYLLAQMQGVFRPDSR